MVVNHIDHVLMTGSQNEKLSFKETFGLGGLQYDDDFAM